MKILLSLVLIYFLGLPAGAIETAEGKFKRWPPGDVAVKLVGFNEYQENIFKQRVAETIGRLPLDINIVYSDTGNIKIALADDIYDTTHECFYTRGVIGFKSTQIGSLEIWEPIQYQTIKIDTTCLEEYPEAVRENVFLNIALHELMHGLMIKDHTTNYYGKIPTSLMNPNVQASGKLYWTYNDKRLLLEKYGKHGKKFSFEKEDIGKTCVLIYQKRNHSVSFKITETEMYIPYLKKGKFKVKNF